VTETAQAQAQGLLRGCGLPQAWGDQSAWRILDTQFQAHRFLLTWRTWLADARRPRLLHYVALSPQAPDASALLQAAAPYPDLLPLAQELAAQCFGLLPGFHRLTLQQGQVLLTLCVGESRACCASSNSRPTRCFWTPRQMPASGIAGQSRPWHAAAGAAPHWR